MTPRSLYLIPRPAIQEPQRKNFHGEREIRPPPKGMCQPLFVLQVTLPWRHRVRIITVVLRCSAQTFGQQILSEQEVVIKTGRCYLPTSTFV